MDDRAYNGKIYDALKHLSKSMYLNLYNRNVKAMFDSEKQVVVEPGNFEIVPMKKVLNYDRSLVCKRYIVIFEQISRFEFIIYTKNNKSLKAPVVSFATQLILKNGIDGLDIRSKGTLPVYCLIDRFVPIAMETRFDKPQVF